MPAPQEDRYIIARELLDPAPYYVSHDSAMDVHNMLTRPVTSVTVTSPRRPATREILGIPYRHIYAPPMLRRPHFGVKRQSGSRNTNRWSSATWSEPSSMG